MRLFIAIQLEDDMIDALLQQWKSQRKLYSVAGDFSADGDHLKAWKGSNVPIGREMERCKSSDTYSFRSQSYA